jgi:hypothetical protein
MEANQMTPQGNVNPPSGVTNPIPSMDTNVLDQGVNLESGGNTPEANTQALSGKYNWGKIIGYGLFALTSISLILNVIVQRKNLVRLNKDDESMRKDINELKFNLKKKMGGDYEELP